MKMPARAVRRPAAEELQTHDKQHGRGDDDEQGDRELPRQVRGIQFENVPEEVRQQLEDDAEAADDVDNADEADGRRAVEPRRGCHVGSILHGRGHGGSCRKKDLCANPLSASYPILGQAGAEGVEPPTGRFGDGCSAN